MQCLCTHISDCLWLANSCNEEAFRDNIYLIIASCGFRSIMELALTSIVSSGQYGLAGVFHSQNAVPWKQHLIDAEDCKTRLTTVPLLQLKSSTCWYKKSQLSKEISVGRSCHRHLTFKFNLYHHLSFPETHIRQDCLRRIYFQISVNNGRRVSISSDLLESTWSDMTILCGSEAVPSWFPHTKRWYPQIWFGHDVENPK